MICLCLTSATLEENAALFAGYQKEISLYELRVDILEAKYQDWNVLAQWMQEMHALYGEDSFDVIFTIRVANDGGKWLGREKERVALLTKAIESELFLWVDIESNIADYGETTCETMYELAIKQLNTDVVGSIGDSNGKGDEGSASGTGESEQPTSGIIISTHEFFELPVAIEVPVAAETSEASKVQSAPVQSQSQVQDKDKAQAQSQDQDQNQAALAASSVAGKKKNHTSSIKNLSQTIIERSRKFPRALIKKALYCNSSAQLCDFLAECAVLRDVIPQRYVVASMGIYGMPARILSVYTGTRWSYCSDHGLANLGHISPRMCIDTYRYKEITIDSEIYAIVGNPVMHSQSPNLHNEFFVEAGHTHKIYMHLPIDDCGVLPRLASLIKLRGLSVTIPHKHAIVAYLHSQDEYVLMSQSCNTVLIKDRRWAGYNTDIPGFLQPLQSYLGLQQRSLANLNVCIIGAGATARALCVAFLSLGCRVLIVNRTFERAQALVEFLRVQIPRAEVNCAALDAYEKMKEYSDIIVQTSSAGMGKAQESPLPDYPFRGTEIVYDVVYTPPQTKIMKDAEAAGCHTISGLEMFLAQGRMQSRLFMGSR